MRVSRSKAGKASLIVLSALSLSACVTTDSHLTVRSSYGGIAQKLAKIKLAVPTCQHNEQLQIRVNTRTEAWVDTDSRYIRPNEVNSMHEIHREYRCRAVR